jgi:hypothetical protein
MSHLETELSILGAAVEAEEEGEGEEGDESSELSDVDIDMILDFIDHDPDDKPQLGPGRKDGEGQTVMEVGLAATLEL